MTVPVEIGLFSLGVGQFFFGQTRSVFYDVPHKQAEHRQNPNDNGTAYKEFG